MKKLFLFLLCSFCLVGCTNVPVYVFAVNNENVEISVDVSGDVLLKEKEDGFSIEADHKTIQGMFIKTEVFKDYYDTVVNDESAKILFQNDNQLIWQIDGESGMEQDCICRVTDQTSVLMGSLDDVESIYQGLSFKKK